VSAFKQDPSKIALKMLATQVVLQPVHHLILC